MFEGGSALADLPLGNANNLANNAPKSAEGLLNKNATRNKIFDMADDAFVQALYSGDVDLDDMPQLSKWMDDVYGEGNWRWQEIAESDLKNFRSTGYTWHEYIDANGIYRVQLISRSTHSTIGHSGGIADLAEIIKKIVGGYN